VTAPMNFTKFRESPHPDAVVLPEKSRRNRPKRDVGAAAARGRSAEEIRDAMIVLCDRMLAAIELRSNSTRGTSAVDLLSLTKINVIISAHLRAQNQNPIDRRPGETDDDYRKRLESMR
jgi:hypothetical protein